MLHSLLPVSGSTTNKHEHKETKSEFTKGISDEAMARQLSDTSDIVSVFYLAPVSKKMMHWEKMGGVRELFAFPGRPILSPSQSTGRVSKGRAELRGGAAFVWG